MDYDRIALVAERLIASNGRLINIVRIQRGPVDPAKPWRGDPTPREDNPGDPDSVVVLANIRAAFVEPSSLVRFGFKSEEFEGVRRVEQVALIAASSLGGQDLTNYDEIEDGSVNYKIELTRRISPAGIPILYMVGIRR